MIVVWAIALVGGIVAASYASRRAVDRALDIADRLDLSTGLVGVTVVAIGTDLPEIANSISSSVTGHGDVNVGNATGSTLTQITLILAILALRFPALRTAGREDRRGVELPIGLLTVGATLLIAVLILDEHLSRTDGALLVGVWVVGMLLVNRWQRTSHLLTNDSSRRGKLGMWRLLGWLAVVAGSATLVVQAFVRISDDIGVPELVASTVVLALGTSLPELVVDWTALRRGAAALAVGDLFGSSLVDASLAIGIGPLIRPTVVSGQAVSSVLVVAAGVAAATLIWRLRRADSLTPAVSLLLVYGVCMAVIVGVGSS
ncbi:sodium:calcium antiporter [Ilumatobacter sp.]|uniref:sodium:calcium antiporter n=1 Tax=Ilumatobacter sp. TaxID=1967498 RepID=UPI003AF86526